MMASYFLPSRSLLKYYYELLANENFPYKSIYYLKSKGFDILSIGMDNPSILDSEIMSISIKEERTILTFDRDLW